MRSPLAAAHEDVRCRTSASWRSSTLISFIQCETSSGSIGGLLRVRSWRWGRTRPRRPRALQNFVLAERLLRYGGADHRPTASQRHRGDLLPDTSSRSTSSSTRSRSGLLRLMDQHSGVEDRDRCAERGAMRISWVVRFDRRDRPSRRPPLSVVRRGARVRLAAVTMDKARNLEASGFVPLWRASDVVKMFG